MHPFRGNIRQRHQNKRTVLNTRVGQNESIGGNGHLVLEREVAPMFVCGHIRRDMLAISDQIQIKCSLAPTSFSGSAKFGLDRMKAAQNQFRWGIRAYQTGAIYKIRAGTLWKTRSFVELAYGINRISFGKRFEGALNHGACLFNFWGLIAPKGNKHLLAFFI
jgi:hypothetical protein